jgi:ferritin heavy chain
MKLIILSVVLLAAAVKSSTQDMCTAKGTEAIPTWTDIESSCYASIQNQIQEEFTASITYLAMGAYFSRDASYRPGLAKFFLDSAIEEREHAKKLIGYLHMRGGSIGSTSIKTIEPKIGTGSWDSMKDALQVALNLERGVTTNIKKIIATCEGVNADKHGINDYHAVDYLTGEFLQEQYEGMRKISGHLVTMTRMYEQYGNLGEIIFDKQFPL